SKVHIQLQIFTEINFFLNVDLGDDATVLEEVVVTSESEDKNVRNTEMSVNTLNVATISKLPALLGEVDVIRSIQLLPGVSTVGEGATGFNVRGGGVDQNLVLLDEAPVYNSSHLFGFFSVFNPDAVKDVKLYKGGIPAQYGGRLSSILDVRMKEGNSKKLAVSGGVGLIFSRLSVEAPIVKDKASFIFAARRSYIDVLAKPFLNNNDLGDSKLNFYDLTLKTNYKISNKDRIYLSGYLGRDVFGFGDAAGFDWGNATTTLRWNHLFNDKLFSNFTAYYSNYDYQINFGDTEENSFDWDANIVNYSLKSDVSWFINPDNLITFGGQAIIYEFSPGNAVGVSEGETTNFSVPKKYALEAGLFIENDQTINDKLSLRYGLRWSHFNYMGEGRAFDFETTEVGESKQVVGEPENFDQWESIKMYSNFEPRVSLKYQLNKASSLKLSYNRMAQYLHLISNSTAASPLDVWTPSTNNIEPQIANQFAIGYFRNFKDNRYATSIETYYKAYENLVDYIDGADLFVNELLEAELLAGKGRAYGIELQVEKTKGQFTGWLSYTLARSERKIEGLNNDEWYLSRFDQLHNFSATLFYELGKRWTLSGNFVINTGTPASFPTDRFEQQGYVVPHNAAGSRNNVRIPAYHRLDLAATFKGKERKRWNSEWVFSVYNVYNRRNPFSIYFRQQEVRPIDGSALQTEAVRLSVIGSIIPSVAYNFKF
ncbi:MAG: TonB-dependent receptor, partial [Bacteroidota bacterium]